ncbi:MAG: hypothetical protein R3D25_11505 [Geminicoccaceae bacterium]
MRLARLCATCLLSAGVSMFTSCGSFQIGSTVGAGELPGDVASEQADFRVERVASGLEHPGAWPSSPTGASS